MFIHFTLEFHIKISLWFSSSGFNSTGFRSSALSAFGANVRGVTRWCTRPPGRARASCTTMPFGRPKVKVFDCFSYNGESVVVSCARAGRRLHGLPGRPGCEAVMLRCCEARVSRHAFLHAVARVARRPLLALLHAVWD